MNTLPENDGWIVVDKFPFPPSTNHLYASFVRNGKIMRVPSKELQAYKRSLKDYQLGFDLQMQEIIHSFKLKAGTELEMYIELHAPFEKYYCKDGHPKKLDISNRLKALEDAFFALLGIDDSLVKKITAIKRVAPNTEVSWAKIHIRPFPPA